MKKFIALASIALIAGSANAQNETSSGSQDIGTAPLALKGKRHMFEFNAESMTSAVWAFDKSKVKGQESENDSRWNLALNYAYGVHRHVQAGIRATYFNGIVGNVDQEVADLSVGGWFNQSENFESSAYLSLFVGAGWAQTFGVGGARDNILHSSLALGKRFPLTRFGIEHVTFSPEVALKYANSTDDENFDYQQALEFRLLQFSVFF